MKKFRPTARENGDEVHRSVETMRVLRQLGIVGVRLPEEVGGGGRPAISGILAVERIARACPRTGAAAVMAIAGPGMFIARLGNSSQKAEYLPPMSSYSLERTAAGARALGVAPAAFEMARDHSMERKQFGRPICEFQLVQGRLADMWLRLGQARWLVYKACVDAEGAASRMESSVAKVAATEASVFVTDQAMQMFGASGMSHGTPLERMYCMVRPYTVAGGTSDIHRIMIASEILLRRFVHQPALV